jgi:hypothetical protein
MAADIRVTRLTMGPGSLRGRPPSSGLPALLGLVPLLPAAPVAASESEARAVASATRASSSPPSVSHRNICPVGSARLTGSLAQYAYGLMPPAPNGLKLSGELKRISPGRYQRYPLPSGYALVTESRYAPVKPVLLMVPMGLTLEERPCSVTRSAAGRYWQPSQVSQHPPSRRVRPGSRVVAITGVTVG